jgi:hypothetical protein
MPCYYRIIVSTTKDEINTGLARATNPVECVERLSLAVYIDFWGRTPIFICAYAGGWLCPGERSGKVMVIHRL